MILEPAAERSQASALSTGRHHQPRYVKPPTHSHMNALPPTPPQMNMGVVICQLPTVMMTVVQ